MVGILKIRAPRSGMAVATMAAVLLVGTPQAHAETTFERIKREKLITFGFANEPPYTIAALEKVTGQDPETLKAIMGQFGIEHYNGVLAEFAGMIPGLVAKRFDVIAAGMSIRPARCKQVAFSNPNLVVQQGLAVKKGNPLNLHSLKDIAANSEARVGVLQGGVQYEYLELAGVKQNQIFGFPDNTSMFQAFRTDRVDAVTLDVPLLGGQLAALKDPNLVRADPFEPPVGKDGKPIGGYVGVGFRKEDNDLREAYNRELKKLLESGRLAEIIAPFGFTKADLPDPNVTAEQICSGS